MKNFRSMTALQSVILSLIILINPYSYAHVNISNAQVRLLPSVVPNTSAYLRLENDTTQPLILVSASSPVSKKVEIHNHIHEGGVMKMVHLPSLIVPPGETLHFQPGGYHLMLLGLKKPLKEGQIVPITVTTKGGYNIAIEAKVAKTIAKHHH